MNYDETVAIMGILKTAYPEYYRGMKRAEADKTVALWAELLEPYPAEACAVAVKRLISESPYAPKISDVINRVKELRSTDSAAEAWNVFAKAAARASVVTPEEFKALPVEVQIFCGDLRGLIVFGMTAEETFNTVTRGQFLKAFDGLKRRRETLELMPPGIKSLVIAEPKALTAG